MKHFNRLMMGSLILIISLSLFPSFLAIYGSTLSKKPLMKESDWIPPEPDNLYYTEDLDVNILKDGSVEKQWSLVDHGIGNITFPINLTTPVNLSSLALEDLRVRLAITQHDNYPHAWGPFIYRGSTEFMFEDEFESIVSHIFLEFYALINDAGNQSLIFSLLDNCTAEFESLWEGVTFFKFDQFVIPGSAGRRISQTWRAFPSNDLLETVFEYLLDNCLPTNIGLFKVEKNNFVNSEHKSIHIAANWDGYNESSSEDYYREPSLPGNTEDLDDRWEYIAGIYEYDSEAIQIEENSENTLYFTDTTAYNVDVDDIYPMENFTIISGSPSETWAYLPPGVEFTYSYIVKYPEGISSDTQVSYLTATYDYSYLWYGGSSWEGSFAFSAQAAGFIIGDIFGTLLALGFMSATTVAVILGVILLRKRGL